MRYEDVLKVLAVKNGVTEKEIENEMQLALKLAGLECTVKEFINDVSFFCEQNNLLLHIV